MCENDRILGVIYLKDTVKPGMVERFERLRAIGIKTIMCTGDNPLTAATIAKEAGVDAAGTSVMETPAVTTEPEPEIVIHSERETEDAGPDGQGDYYLPEERTEKDGMIRSYLTGKMVPVSQGSRRPAAVMMSNDKEARPQYGINRAGVVYEAPVEGGMNRYMSLIEDYDDLERIGSVRSCRTYYTYFAREFDAVYVHFGQSTFAKPYLGNVDNINGLEGIGTTAFYRTKDKKSPHNAYTSGDRITASIEKLGVHPVLCPVLQGPLSLCQGRQGGILNGASGSHGRGHG